MTDHPAPWTFDHLSGTVLDANHRAVFKGRWVNTLDGGRERGKDALAHAIQCVNRYADGEPNAAVDTHGATMKRIAEAFKDAPEGANAEGFMPHYGPDDSDS